MANTTNWLSISSQSGSSGQTILTLSANKNLSAGTKTAEVTAYNPVYNISAKTYVTIDAYSPYIYVSDSIIGIPASGGTYQLGIESNCSFVIAYPNMVSTYSTSAGTGNISVTFSVPATYQSQTITENIVITDESGQYSIVVRLEQYGSEPEISAVPPELLFEANGGTLYFTVSANCVYHINNSAISGWCGVSPQSGYTGSTTFTVTTTANTGDSAKTGIISVIGPGTAGDMVQVRQKRTTVQIPYTADTSTIAASGETRTITIDTTGLVDSSITVDIQNAPGATYTYSNGVITVTIPDNSGSTRDVVVSITGKTTGGDDAATSITFTQAEHTTVQIPYTADTSTVDASGETRTITIDTSNLVASSITIGIDGATGVTYTYNNGVVTVVFPDNSGPGKHIIINVSAETFNGETAIAAISYEQEGSSTPSDYLTFNIIDGGTISWQRYGQIGPYYPAKTIQYSKNDDEWISITSNNGSSAPTITVEAGDNVRFRGDNNSYSFVGAWDSFQSSGATFSLDGNIMSLVDSTGFSTANTLETGYTFRGLFYNCTGLTSASRLLLPATSLTESCYENMFNGCTSLTQAPALPATALTNSCYSGMFSGCTSLTGVSSNYLPATTLGGACYANMFYGCTSFTAPPALPATTLAVSCYNSMFNGCTSLTVMPTLPATTMAVSCYAGMFSNCTSLTGVSSNYLPATTLADGCYSSMFWNCTGLTSAPELPATVMVSDPDYVKATGCYNGMFGGCTSLRIPPALPATTLAYFCYASMFMSCTSLIAAPALPATTLAESCYEGMFWGCTGLTSAPVLRATTLVDACYSDMFWNCKKLNYIKCFATDISASNCTNSWVGEVASSGTFVKDRNMTGWTRGLNGIPSGWTVQDAR